MQRRKFSVLAKHLQDIMEESLPKMVDDRIKGLLKTQVSLYVAQGLIMERQQSQADVAKTIADAIQQECENLRSKISSHINDDITNHIPSHVDSFVRNYMSSHILHVHPTQATLVSAQEQQYQLYLIMRDNPQLQQEDLPILLALKYKLERLHVFDTSCRPSAVRPRVQDDPYDDAHPEGENDAKRQKTSEHGTYVSGESSSGQDNKSEPGPSTSGNQEQSDDFDFWRDSYATDDDELPIEKVLQELVDEMSQTVDEAKLCKVVNEIKEILVSPYPERPTPVVQSCQRDPKAPGLSLVNQDLLYLKKGSSEPEKIMMSLHKFPAVIFPDDDIEERTSRWVDKCIEKYKMFSIIYEPVYAIIYKNIKKEKRVMRHQEVHKFCDATLKRVIEGLKSYNNDVKHGYITPSLSKDDDEYLQLFEEEIEE
ncbi:hypothetical protein Tco_0319660 [Tanacetum coccineum]